MWRTVSELSDRARFGLMSAGSSILLLDMNTKMTCLGTTRPRPCDISRPCPLHPVRATTLRLAKRASQSVRPAWSHRLPRGESCVLMRHVVSTHVRCYLCHRRACGSDRILTSARSQTSPVIKRIFRPLTYIPALSQNYSSRRSRLKCIKRLPRLYRRNRLCRLNSLGGLKSVSRSYSSKDLGPLDSH